MEQPTGPYRTMVERASPMTADTWAELAELVRRRSSVQSLLAYILQLAHADMMSIVTESPFEAQGQTSIARLQGAVNAKRFIVGHICDMLGDNPIEDPDNPIGSEANPVWLDPDDEEEEQEKRKRAARRAPARPHPQRAKPTPPRRKPTKRTRR